MIDWTNISDYASIHHVYRKIRKKKPSFNSHNKYQVEKGFGQKRDFGRDLERV
jgi:hypothetical protein